MAPCVNVSLRLLQPRGCRFASVSKNCFQSAHRKKRRRHGYRDIVWCALSQSFQSEWRVTQLCATFVAPLLIAALYVSLLISHKAPSGAGFSSLAQVSILFSSPYALLAGWIHYLAFDLFTGAWEARDAKRVGISQWLVAPCLLLTFFFGPIGLAAYLLLKLLLCYSLGAMKEVV